jgi:hypothetical protein
VSTSGTAVSNVAIQLRNANGAGNFTYDLSGTATRIGRPTQSEASFGCHVWGLRVTSTREGASLGQWRRDAFLNITAYLGPKVVGTELRVLAAANLAADIHRAIEADPSLGGASSGSGTARDLSLVDALLEDERGVQGVDVELTWNWRSTAGGV